MGRTIKSHSAVVWKSIGHIQILTASILPSIHFPFAPKEEGERDSDGGGGGGE